MRLDHLDLHVPNVLETRDFFATHFNLVPTETRGSGLAILRDDAGLELVISRPVAKFGGADTPTAGRNTYHVGFTLNARADVDRLHTALTTAGTEIWMPPREMRGMWLFYCFAPGRILVEVRAP
ncbi:VOC family protein [Shinella zoogloeoides]|uniref:VOC family protein n=1 Tax=Shinella zoogloeoides TaxID=352475 RepID=UPI00273E5515|nr:VOC family protein [Shinella zoogloeoides]WLR94697.1 VOC family protein [Shinella zoogloeoides]